MKFISLSGLAGSGKSTVSKYLISYFKWHRYTIKEFSFAGPLKDALCLLTGWDRARMDWDRDYKEGDTLDDGSPDPYCKALGMTRRIVMQRFGTECLRNGLHSDFWIILADLGLKLGKIPPADIYIVSDTRYLNELQWIKSMDGFQLQIIREDSEQTDHSSEKQWQQWTEFDQTLLNTVDDRLSVEENMSHLETLLDERVIPGIRSKCNLKLVRNDWMAEYR